MSESLIQNKKAYFNYEILEKFSAGMELFGFEVKAIKDKRGSLDGAYAIVRGGEILPHSSQKMFPRAMTQGETESYYSLKRR